MDYIRVIVDLRYRNLTTGKNENTEICLTYMQAGQNSAWLATDSLQEEFKPVDKKYSLMKKGFIEAANRQGLPQGEAREALEMLPALCLAYSNFSSICTPPTPFEVQKVVRVERKGFFGYRKIAPR